MTKMQYFHELEAGLFRCGYVWLGSSRSYLLRAKKQVVSSLADTFRYGGLDALRRDCIGHEIMFRETFETTITGRLNLACFGSHRRWGV